MTPIITMYFLSPNKLYFIFLYLYYINVFSVIVITESLLDLVNK